MFLIVFFSKFGGKIRLKWETSYNHKFPQKGGGEIHMHVMALSLTITCFLA
jgi:hypothetical protein